MIHSFNKITICSRIWSILFLYYYFSLNLMYPWLTSSGSCLPSLDSSFSAQYDIQHHHCHLVKVQKWHQSGVQIEAISQNWRCLSPKFLSCSCLCSQVQLPAKAKTNSFSQIFIKYQLLYRFSCYSCAK